jgi:hypothetical protein
VVVNGERGIVGTMSVAAPINRLGSERIAAILPDLRRSAEAMALAWHDDSAGKQMNEALSSTGSSKLTRRVS